MNLTRYGLCELHRKQLFAKVGLTMKDRDSIPMTLAQALRGRRKVRVWVRKPNQGTGGQRSGDIPKKFLAMNGFLREGGTRWHAGYEDSLKVGYATVIVSLEPIGLEAAS